MNNLFQDQDDRGHTFCSEGCIGILFQNEQKEEIPGDIPFEKQRPNFGDTHPILLQIFFEKGHQDLPGAMN
jgi:hypothetical protein